jgi:pyruvate ferredoxin oxidoreductase alpha subunit
VFIETCAALFNANTAQSPKVVDYIYGLGGRDVTPDQIRQAFDDLRQIAETGQIKRLIGYLGLRD